MPPRQHSRRGLARFVVERPRPCNVCRLSASSHCIETACLDLGRKRQFWETFGTARRPNRASGLGSPTLSSRARPPVRPSCCVKCTEWTCYARPQRRAGPYDRRNAQSRHTAVKNWQIIPALPPLGAVVHGVYRIDPNAHLTSDPVQQTVSLVYSANFVASDIAKLTKSSKVRRK